MAPQQRAPGLGSSWCHGQLVGVAKADQNKVMVREKLVVVVSEEKIKNNSNISNSYGSLIRSSW